MNPGFDWNKAARVEMDAAFDWYEQQSPGLGWQFTDEVQTALVTIQAQPNAFPITQAKL